jgi:hypothetical protein
LSTHECGERAPGMRRKEARRCGRCPLCSGNRLATEARAGGGVLGATAETEAKVFRRGTPGTPASALDRARTAAAIDCQNNVKPPRPWK